MQEKNEKSYLEIDTTFVDFLLNHYLELDSKKVAERNIIDDLLSLDEVSLFYLQRTDIERFSQLISVLDFHCSNKNFREQFFQKREENSYKFKMIVAKLDELVNEMEALIKDDNFCAKSSEEEFENCINNMKSLINRLSLYLPEFQQKKEVKVKEIFVPIELNLAGLPKFNLQTRFRLFEKLGFDDIIRRLKTKNQNSKDLIIALLMGISPSNAKHLLNMNYKEMDDKDENKFNHFIENEHIKFSDKEKG